MEALEQDPLCRAEYFTVSVPRFLTYSLASFGLWPFYWVYRNWRAISKAGYKKKFSPLVRTVFFYATAYSLLQKILVGAKRLGYSGHYNPSLLAVLLFILGAISRVAGKLPEIMPEATRWAVLVSLAVIVLEPFLFVPPVKAVQFVTAQQGRELKANNKLTVGQMVIFAVGLLAWIGTFFPGGK